MAQLVAAVGWHGLAVIGALAVSVRSGGQGRLVQPVAGPVVEALVQPVAGRGAGARGGGGTVTRGDGGNGGAGLAVVEALVVEALVVAALVAVLRTRGRT